MPSCLAQSPIRGSLWIPHQAVLPDPLPRLPHPLLHLVRRQAEDQLPEPDPPGVEPRHRRLISHWRSWSGSTRARSQVTESQSPALQDAGDDEVAVGGPGEILEAVVPEQSRIDTGSLSAGS